MPDEGVVTPKRVAIDKIVQFLSFHDTSWAIMQSCSLNAAPVLAPKTEDPKEVLQESNKQQLASLFSGEMRGVQSHPQVSSIQAASSPADGFFPPPAIPTQGVEEDPRTGEEGKCEEDRGSTSRQSLSVWRRTTSAGTHSPKFFAITNQVGESETSEEARFINF